MHLGEVLGIETYKDTAKLVQGVLNQTWQETFTTRDISVISLAMVTVLILVMAQTFNLTTSRKRKFSWTKVMLAILFDILIFGLLIVGHLRLLNYILEIRAPRQVRIERVSPELVSVNWKTYDPESSVVYWGYEPDNLQNAELGLAGSHLSREHEVLITVEPGREVYLRIAVGREQYGVNVSRGGTPYGVNTGVK